MRLRSLVTRLGQGEGRLIEASQRGKNRSLVAQPYLAPRSRSPDRHCLPVLQHWLAGKGLPVRKIVSGVGLSMSYSINVKTRIAS
jgi:hypothetical protein